MSGERTEKPTAKKRSEAQKKGDRLVSREVMSAAALLAGIMTLAMVAESWLRAWEHGYQQSLAIAFTSLGGAEDAALLAARCRTVAVAVVAPMLAVAVAACAAAAGAGLLQGGGQLRPASITPKLSKLSPLRNMKNLFGQQAAVRLLKTIVPVAGVAYLAILQAVSLEAYPILSRSRIPAAFSAVYALAKGAAMLMMLWSAIDLLSSWRSREQRLKMTKQDVKDEARESEGSPQIKRRIRSIQRQMRGRKLRADVSKATLVVTNPTHYAVALSFDFEKMDPPLVHAKGKGILAASIREEARWAGIPIVENPPLARSLYKLVEPGQSIPLELYAAVAAILAFLYRSEVEKRMRSSAAQLEHSRIGSTEKVRAIPGPADGIAP